MRRKRNKENLSFGLLAIFVCLTLLVGCTKKEIRNLDSKGKEIICFGNSLTYGYGVESNQSYPSVLAQKIDLAVINAGVNGDTTSSALARLEKDVLSHDPYLVIVELGANDFLTKMPMQETVKNLSQIIDKIQAKGAIVALVDISAGLLFKEYKAQYKKLAQVKGAIFIPDVLTGIITNPNLKSDFLHPNGEGYSLMAARIYDKIKLYLKKRK